MVKMIRECLNSLPNKLVSTSLVAIFMYSLAFFEHLSHMFGESWAHYEIGPT